jgi:hypothetical protein
LAGGNRRREATQGEQAAARGEAVAAAPVFAGVALLDKIGSVPWDGSASKSAHQRAASGFDELHRAVSFVISFISFPSSAWERRSTKLCFACWTNEVHAKRSFEEMRSQAELGNEGYE